MLGAPSVSAQRNKPLMPGLKLPRALVAQLLSEAQGSPSAEVCGLMSARDGEPVRLYPVPNISPTPERLFRMDPKAQIDAMRRMRDAGETLFAIYHSHPHGPATPSAEDLAQAAYPEALYLIVSLQAPEAAQLRAFWLRGGQAEPVELQI